MSEANGWPTTRVALLERMRSAEDQAAWQSFVDLYSPIVYRYGRVRGLQHADAQGVTQDVFYRVAHAIREFRYDPARGKFRSWLGLITHQQVLRCRADQRRRVRTSHTVSDLDEEFAGEAEGVWIEAFNAHIYRAALQAVRPKFEAQVWDAFERVWCCRENPGDVARDCGRDPQWMYQLKFQIIELLKMEVERLAADAAILHRN